jgi:hypothetical protein
MLTYQRFICVLGRCVRAQHASLGQPGEARANSGAMQGSFVQKNDIPHLE